MKPLDQIKDPWYRANRDKISAQRKAEYAANPEPAKRRALEWRRNNPEKAQANSVVYRNANRKKLAAKMREYYYANHQECLAKFAARRERKRPEQRAFARHKSATLSDQYVREQLAKYSPLSMKDFPQELVEVKRLYIQMKRITHKNRKIA